MLKILCKNHKYIDLNDKNVKLNNNASSNILKETLDSNEQMFIKAL